MTHEQVFHDASSFLTLTYNPENLPRFGQLVKKDLQDCFKRLRYYLGPFRYVACGEFGEHTRRAHFHVACFGFDFAFDRVQWGESIKGDTTYMSSTLNRIWGKGNTLVGSLTFESCAYIGRYICGAIKGVGASKLPLACDPDSGELIMPESEFLLCSRKPPIGRQWFDKYFMDDVFPHGRVITAQGTPAPVPTAYKRWLRAMNYPLYLELSAIIAKNNIPTHEQVARARVEDSNERRVARNVYANARAKAFAREIKE